MNGIIYAGAPLNADKERLTRQYEVIVAEGRCEITCASGKFEFDRGEAAVIPPLLKHEFKGDGTALVIEQALLPFKEVRIVRDDGAGGMAHAAKQAVKYYKNDGLAEALGGLVVGYLIAFSGAEGYSPVVAGLIAEIKRNLTDATYSLEDGIRKLPLNYDYVRKLFKREVGVTPHEYLLNGRMKLARDLLASGISNQYSNYSVAQIAEACGFSEPLYFSRVFKKYYGKSPSDYRAALS